MDDNLNELVQKMIKSQETIIESQNKIMKYSSTKSFIIGILLVLLFSITSVFIYSDQIKTKNFNSTINTMYQETVKAFENQQITVETSADASGSTVSTTNNNNNNNVNNTNTINNKK